MSNLSNLSPKEEVALTTFHLRGGAVDTHQITSLRGVSQQPPFFLLLCFMKSICLWKQFLNSLTPPLLFQTKDCNVVASKLMFLLDDLLWVLTDSQLKAMMKYAESLSEAMEKSAQQRKSLAPESVQVSELGCWSASEKDSFCLCGIWPMLAHSIFLDGNSCQVTVMWTVGCCGVVM